MWPSHPASPKRSQASGKRSARFITPKTSTTCTRISPRLSGRIQRRLDVLLAFAALVPSTLIMCVPFHLRALTRRSDLWMPCRLSVTLRASIAHLATFPVKPRTPFISVLPKTQTYTCFFHPVEMVKTHCEAKGVALLSAHIPLLRKRTVFFCKIFRHL